MKEEINYFKGYKLNKDKLIKYGFNKEKDEYHYLVNILNDDFCMYVDIVDNKIYVKIVDLSTNLEYTNYRLSNKGEFAFKVYNEYERVLLSIRNSCFEKEYFLYDQSNRITKYIINKYNSYPEYPWDDNNGIFRCPNNKWFAVILSVNKNKFTNENKNIEVLNIKVDNNIEDLIKIEGIYKAYHMNKSKWISICLDEELDDKEIFNYVDISYKIVNKK